MKTTKAVTLVGMPSAGKSTVGVLLAKRLGYTYIDGDILIQERTGKLLSEIMEERGLAGFLEVENEVNASVRADRAVIAPGGSVIYCRDAMAHLSAESLIVYLKISFEEMLSRIGDVKDRGVALRPGFTLRDLYDERTVLYEAAADLTVDVEGRSVGSVVDELRERIETGRI